MGKTKQRYVSNYEFVKQREEARQRFVQSRDNYLTNSGKQLYSTSWETWSTERDQARIVSEATRRQRLNNEILQALQKVVYSYGTTKSKVEFTRKEFAVIQAIFTLCRLSTDLYAAESTIAKEARCSRRTVTYTMRRLESMGVLHRTRTGGRIPGVWIVKETNRYQVRYDVLRDLLGLSNKSKQPINDFLQEYRRLKGLGQDPTMPSRRWGWPSISKQLQGIKDYSKKACGKLPQKIAIEQQFCAQISLKNFKVPISALSTYSLTENYLISWSKSSPQQTSLAPFNKEKWL